MTFLLGHTKLTTFVAVVDVFVDRYVDNMLASAGIDVFAGAVLRPKNFAFACGCVVQYSVVRTLFLLVSGPFLLIVSLRRRESSLTHIFL